MIEPYCCNYLGYRHTSGVRAYCGDDVGTRIIRCEECKKKIKQFALHESEELA